MISEERLAELLAPYLERWCESWPVPAGIHAKFVVYLELLIRWNQKTNLTAVREPEEMVRRHFGESLFAGSVLGSVCGGYVELLDLGSGGGFPGVPMQLLRPDWRVTLAESQGKKAAFLREVVRVLDLPSVVWAGRVEAMPTERRFEAVAMRAVDRMDEMEGVAVARLRPGGLLLRMTTERRAERMQVAVPGLAASYVELSWPGSRDVPRETLD